MTLDEVSLVNADLGKFFIFLVFFLLLVIHTLFTFRIIVVQNGLHKFEDTVRFTVNIWLFVESSCSECSNYASQQKDNVFKLYSFF